MKWLKEHKREIITLVQFFLVVYMMIHGFLWSYLWVLFIVGLPIEWWSIVTSIILAGLSVFGLCQWIVKGGNT